MKRTVHQSDIEYLLDRRNNAGGSNPATYDEWISENVDNTAVLQSGLFGAVEGYNVAQTDDSEMASLLYSLVTRNKEVIEELLSLAKLSSYEISKDPTLLRSRIFEGKYSLEEIRLAKLSKAKLSLSKSQVNLLIMMSHENLSIQQLAERVRESKSTVEYRLKSAIKKVQNLVRFVDSGY